MVLPKCPGPYGIFIVKLDNFAVVYPRYTRLADIFTRKGGLALAYLPNQSSA